MRYERRCFIICDKYKINRLDFLILQKLSSMDCNSYYNGITITELLDECNGVLGPRMTIYKKLKILVEIGYISKGIIDNHADTYYIKEKGINVIGGKINGHER